MECTGSLPLPLMEKEIEPLVPDVETVIDTFRQLAEITGPDSMGWRYDPIFLNDGTGFAGSCYGCTAESCICHRAGTDSAHGRRKREIYDEE